MFYKIFLGTESHGTVGMMEPTKSTETRQDEMHME